MNLFVVDWVRTAVKLSSLFINFLKRICRGSGVTFSNKNNVERTVLNGVFFYLSIKHAAKRMKDVSGVSSI